MPWLRAARLAILLEPTDLRVELGCLGTLNAEVRGLLDYTKTVTFAAPAPDLRLDLGRVCHVAEVWVNGESCGARLWGPHVFVVGPALKPGANEVRVRVGNLINNTYGEPAESGLLGPVRLVRIR